MARVGGISVDRATAALTAECPELAARSDEKSIGSFKFMRGDRKRMSDKTPVYGK